MAVDRRQHPIVHFVGSVPLPDAETAFRTLAAAAGPHLLRLPDGETGIRKTWIRFLQAVLAENPAIEVADDVPPFKFTQWDGKLLREIPRLRIKPGAAPDPARFDTGYAEMAIQSWGLFERLQTAGVIPAEVRFQVSLPTPIAPTYNNMVPSDRPKLLPALTEHLIGEVAKIAAAIPQDRLALQWDVCQEVLALEGYYEPGPVDFRSETLSVLIRIGNAVPAAIELGYHLCYGSPADEHCVQPKDMGIMVELANAVAAGIAAPDPVLSHAGAERSDRRRLFCAARSPAPRPRHRALSRPHPLRRCRGRSGKARRGTPSCACRRHRHRMRHGARRPGAARRASRRPRPRRRTSGRPRRQLTKPTAGCERGAYLTKVTGMRASRTIFEETDPRTAPRNGPKPRVPITI